MASAPEHVNTNATDLKGLEAGDNVSLSHSKDDKDEKGDLNTLEQTATEIVAASQEYTEDQYKKLTRKIDYYLVPIMFFMYGIQQTDKTSISVQALFGMNTELGLVGQQYQWLTTIFYVTYLIGEFPSTWLMQRYKIGRVLTIYMIGWSVTLLCISACNNWNQLMALRALQGFFESNITPGFLLITGQWYRTAEHANRSLFWQSSQGALNIVFNLALYGIARHVSVAGGIAAWRCISLFLGALTLAGSVACYFILGSPDEVLWLSPEEKKMAKARVFENQIGEESTTKAWNWDQCWECFRDPQVYFGFLNTFLACIPNGGITAFSTLLYVTFGFDSWGSMLWSLPRSGIYVVIFLLTAWYLRVFQNQRMYIMIISCILPFVGLLVMSLLQDAPENKWIKISLSPELNNILLVWSEVANISFYWAMFNVTCVFSLALFLGWSMITSNIAGGTKRTVVSSLTLISYCVGNMVGAQVFQTKEAPRYLTGTAVCAACFGAEVIVVILWRLWYMRENRRRDKWAAEQGMSKEEQERLGAEMGERDMTDLQNPHFRYAM